MTKETGCGRFVDEVHAVQAGEDGRGVEEGPEPSYFLSVRRAHVGSTVICAEDGEDGDGKLWLSAYGCCIVGEN